MALFEHETNDSTKPAVSALIRTISYDEPPVPTVDGNSDDDTLEANLEKYFQHHSPLANLSAKELGGLSNDSSLLWDAIGHDDPVEVARVVANLKDVNHHFEGYGGMTCLHKVVGSPPSQRPNATACLRAVLKHTSLKVDALDDDEQTALHVATATGGCCTEEVVLLLIQAGVPLDTPDTDGCTPLLSASGNAGIGAVGATKALLEGGASIMASSNAGSNCLHAAAAAGSHKVLELLLTTLQQRGDVKRLINAPDEDGLTPLLVSCANVDSTGHAEAIRLLLAFGADASTTDGGGRGAVQLADDYAGYGADEVVRNLLEESQAEVKDIQSGSGAAGADGRDVASSKQGPRAVPFVAETGSGTDLEGLD